MVDRRGHPASHGTTCRHFHCEVADPPCTCPLRRRVVLVDQRRESNAVLEARKLDIPLVSMLDTNCDPALCEGPIPCNDDAVRSVQLILGRLADAINEGRHGSNDQRGGDSEG